MTPSIEKLLTSLADPTINNADSDLTRMSRKHNTLVTRFGAKPWLNRD